MTKFSRFCSDFFRHEKSISWYGRKGVIELDGDRVAQISLSDAGHHNHFSKFEVEIISKTHGKISSHGFSFDDYFRAPLPNINYHVNGSLFKESEQPKDAWYLNEPSREDIDRLAVHICEFIDAYRLTTKKQKKTTRSS